MIKSDFNEQAEFLSKKLKDATSFELENALLNGKLHIIKKESIEDLTEIVYQYYREYNRTYGGGVIGCNINSIIKDALEKYIDVKKDPEKYKIKEEEKYGSESEKLRKESQSAFAEKVAGIDIQLEDGCSLSEIIYDYTKVIVEDPVCEFAFVGNTGPFSIGAENKDGLPIRTQYMDRNGEILKEPIRTYFDMKDKDWHPYEPNETEKPTDDLER